MSKDYSYYCLKARGKSDATRHLLAGNNQLENNQSVPLADAVCCR